MEHKCIYEERWGKLETKIDLWLDIVSAHVKEGDRQGGYRDRVLTLERTVLDAERDKNMLKEEISTIKQGYWKVGLSCGALGGFLGTLIGKITPEISNALAKWIGLL